MTVAQTSTGGALAEAPQKAPAATRRICVVGSGTRFLSGISYYTHRLAAELARESDLTMILMRQLLPRRLYPGRSRVGDELAELSPPSGARVVDGVDWWGRGLLSALRLIRSERPDAVVFQWWTGTVLHHYLVLAWVARRVGAKVIIELHESLDTGELGVPLARQYVRGMAPRLFAMADGFVVHTEHDRARMAKEYDFGSRPVAVIPHGPYDQYRPAKASPSRTNAATRLLYFGVIRPFKGVEDLIAAFDGLSPSEAEGFELTVAGETWEGWTKPAEMIARSPHADSIRFVNRYVTDQEVGELFAAADAVVLPYHRSASSGPLHIAMSTGLPVIVTELQSLREATRGYEGAIHVPPRDPAALRAALFEAAGLRGRRFADPHSWDRTSEGFDSLLDAVGASRGRSA